MIKFLKRIWQKWTYSMVGLSTVIKEEKSIWAYLFLFPIIISLGFVLELNFTQWSITILILFLMFTVEIINTALEAAVDTISFQYNVNVKKIKDIASAATLVINLGSIVSLLLIFIPIVKEMF